jgi:hypothetical protein
VAEALLNGEIRSFAILNRQSHHRTHQHSVEHRADGINT